MLTAIPSDAANLVWIDLLMPDEADIRRIEQDYGIKVPDRAALREIESTSRLRADGDTLYMSVPLLARTGTPQWEIAPTGFILSPKVLVTVRYAQLDLFEAMTKELAEAQDLTRRWRWSGCWKRRWTAPPITSNMPPSWWAMLPRRCSSTIWARAVWRGRPAFCARRSAPSGAPTIAPHACATCF
jgi:hypothetical protein